jgi:hypothetical protein
VLFRQDRKVLYIHQRRCFMIEYAQWFFWTADGAHLKNVMNAENIVIVFLERLKNGRIGKAWQRTKKWEKRESLKTLLTEQDIKKSEFDVETIILSYWSASLRQGPCRVPSAGPASRA